MWGYMSERTRAFTFAAQFWRDKLMGSSRGVCFMGVFQSPTGMLTLEAGLPVQMMTASLNDHRHPYQVLGRMKSMDQRRMCSESNAHPLVL